MRTPSTAAQQARPLIRSAITDKPQSVECASCAARMQMALDQWSCEVCGWLWFITDEQWGIEALGAHRKRKLIVILDITSWAADDPAHPAAAVVELPARTGAGFDAGL